MIFLTLVVGGATRLTESGLSITEWKPVTGVLPPLSQQAWQAEFTEYQAIPQYRELQPRHEPRRSSRRSTGGNGRTGCWRARPARCSCCRSCFSSGAAGSCPSLARAAVGDLRRRRAARRGRLVDGVVRPRRLRPRQRVAISAGVPSDARLRDLRGGPVDRAADRAAAAGRGAAAAAHRRAGDCRAGARADLSRRAGRRPRRRPRLQHLAADRRRLRSGGRSAVVRHAGSGAICSRTRSPCSSTTACWPMRSGWRRCCTPSTPGAAAARSARRAGRWPAR